MKSTKRGGRHCAGDSVGEAARRILAEQFVLLEVNVRRAVSTHSVRAIHDLRVVIRRLRVTLRVFSGVMSGSAAAEYRRQLQALNRSLGPVRDAQVWEALVRRTIRRQGARSTAGLAQSRDAAEGAVAEQLKQLDRCLNGKTIADIPGCRRRVINSLSADWAGTSDSAQAARPFLAKEVLRAYQHLCRGEPPCVDTAAEDVHALRRRSRRVRYLAEMAEPLLGGMAHKLSRRLKQVSTALGEWHDADVQSGLLVQMKSPPDKLIRAVAANRAEGMEKFEETWGRLTAPHFRKHLTKACRAIND